eukprot:3117067-Alexandrium_andersonii.AAC.1
MAGEKGSVADASALLEIQCRGLGGVSARRRFAMRSIVRSVFVFGCSCPHWCRPARRSFILRAL